MEKGNKQQRQLIRDAIEHGGKQQIDEILKAIESTDAIQYTAQLAQREAQLAKDALTAIPDSPYTAALRGVADFSVSRTY